MLEYGMVYLVGGGPGDPDLITVKGLNLLRRADVIIYDRLIAQELLAYARSDAELIYAGKAPSKQRFEQEEINRLLIEKAQAGKLVVRLKGGDPFVFGRGGEEALACHKAGVPFEVVPGVTSAISVPAYAGIPVTHRHISTSFTVFTGHGSAENETGHVDYEALARVGTLVALMGVNQLGNIAERLISAGLSKDTPAACIEWGATAKQRVVEGTLETLPQLVLDAGLQPPCISVIGQVVGLRAEGVRWFDVEEK